MLRRLVPLTIALGVGLGTLLGLLFVPGMARLFLNWGLVLAALALVLGVLNLSIVHGRRLVSQGNLYSLTLLLGLVITLALGLAEGAGLIESGLAILFERVLRPLEAAVGSLIAFFLLFAGFRLLQRQRDGWSILFLITAILILIARAPVPGTLVDLFGSTLAGLDRFISGLVVTAGMRGLLLGIALGSVIVSLRLLTGGERPYDS